MATESFNPAFSNANLTFSNTDRTVAHSAGTNQNMARGTHARSDTSGSFFFSITIDSLAAGNAGNVAVAIGNATETNVRASGYLGDTANCLAWYKDGFVGWGSNFLTAATFTVGDKLGIEWLPAASQLKLYKLVSGS